MKIVSVYTWTAAAFVLLLLAGVNDAKPICSAVEPASYASVVQQYPALAPAINILKRNAIASWYNDRQPDQVSSLLAGCTADTIPAIVIYGLPNKDCAGGFSSGGGNANNDQYKAWIQSLVATVGSREVIYVLEPDAIGLISQGGCGIDQGYLANLKVALALLATNPNAHIYADVAAWATQDAAIATLKELMAVAKLTGIAINTSNYCSTAKAEAICAAYSAATGGLHCVIDTSRNGNGASPQNEWCNAKTAGIGAPPTDATGSALVDYFLWIKVPGESDGECTGRTSDAMIGPSAGAFFYDGFVSLWNQGYYVTQSQLPLIGGNWAGVNTNAPHPATTTNAPPSNNAPPPTTTPPRPTTTTTAYSPTGTTPCPHSHHPPSTPPPPGGPSSTSAPSPGNTNRPSCVPKTTPIAPTVRPSCVPKSTTPAPRSSCVPKSTTPAPRSSCVPKTSPPAGPTPAPRFSCVPKTQPPSPPQGPPGGSTQAPPPCIAVPQSTKHKGQCVGFWASCADGESCTVGSLCVDDVCRPHRVGFEQCGGSNWLQASICGTNLGWTCQQQAPFFAQCVPVAEAMCSEEA
ncbi:Aste57867_13427 [Aphanomyces stellatus]|uniref:Aste57867_13427 protein n=1 Tax=Aphanomyces stellatus TaxID=120398 RepID=A0A485KYU8_9STRA|nr:hypothetical protein As57867_013377 [Aphanomyces stellatus]VFT90266.1 Aste57867_13427 [Aphanomyces stellatus]